MGYIDKNKQRVYGKEWYIRKKNGEETKIVNRKIMSKEERRISAAKCCKTIRLKKIKLINDTLGTKCLICGREDNLRIHQKYNKRHKELANMSFENLKIEINSDKYVKLCQRCHRCVHWGIKYLSLTWEDVSKVITI